MFKRLILITALSFTTLVSTATAQQLTNSGWWIDGVGNTEKSDHAIIIFRAIDNNGRLAICGSIYNRGIPRGLLRNAMSNYLISLGDTPILRNINAFGSASSEEDLVPSAACRETQTQWFEGANEQLSTRLTRRRY